MVGILMRQTIGMHIPYYTSGLPDFSRYMIPKPENVPHEHKMYQMGIKYPKYP
jgi:hypothetical protein